jgi:energy-coupling factor transport system substrate-specific component
MKGRFKEKPRERGAGTGRALSTRPLRYALVGLAALAFALGVKGVAPFDRWSLNSLLLAVALLAILFLRFEEGGYGSREVAVVGALAAVGAAGRVLFVAVPSVQPATFIAIMAGYVFGAELGFMVGALIALLSNLFLGQGPWTPWQMLAWGLAGASGSLASPGRGGVRVWPVAAISTAWGFFFGWLMNLWSWLSFVYPLTWKSYFTICVTSFWFDSFHAAGNLLFALFLTRPVAAMLTRFRQRFAFTYEGGAEDAASENEPLPGALRERC